MNSKNKMLTCLLAGAVGFIVSGGTTSAATTAFADAVGLQSNGYPRWDGATPAASVGKYGGSNFQTNGYVIFSTQAIATANPGIDFTTATFDLAFDTVSINQSSPDLGAGTFVASYIGFYANVADIATTNGFWNGTLSAAPVSDGQTFDTGVTDTAGDGQNLLATGFTLIDADTTSIEANSANDYVAFKFSYTGWGSLPSNTVQELGNFTLSTVVPEPSTSLLVAFAASVLLLRRRRA